jgi:hypothetical protein
MFEGLSLIRVNALRDAKINVLLPVAIWPNPNIKGFMG